MKTILASEMPGFIEKFGTGSQIGKQVSEGVKPYGDLMKEVVISIYDWAKVSDYKIITLVYFKSPIDYYDIVVNYE